MNNYTKYKIKKLKDKAVEKLIDFIFFIPRQVYKNSESFREWIKNSDNKSYEKRVIKRGSNIIFRNIERNEDNKCVVAMFTDFDSDCIKDTDDYDCRRLVEDDVWAKKNKLNLERMTYEDYILKHHIEHKDKLYNYIWNKHKDEEVVIINKIKN